MRQTKNKKSERTSREGNITGLDLFVGEGQEEEDKERGRKMRRKRGKDRILIKNLRNKIIRLPDSKCQPSKGSRWRERETQWKEGRGRRNGGEEIHPEGDRWGWSDGDTNTAPSRRKEYNLSDAKKQHIARKDIPNLPLEGNRAGRSGG